MFAVELDYARCSAQENTNAPHWNTRLHGLHLWSGTSGWNLSNRVALLRQPLFVHRDLWSWVKHPFQSPPLLGQVEQLPFPL